MKAVVYGVGASGSRAARQLLSGAVVEDLVLVDADSKEAEKAAKSLGAPARIASVVGLRQETRIEQFFDAAEHADLVVLTARDDHVELAEAALRNGAHVVSLSDEVSVVDELRGLDALAHEQHRSLLLGAAFSPGLSCLLARHGARQLDSVDELHIAKFGTGGPECARQHHRALREDALTWRDSEWLTSRGGSGRELFWFPDPIGGLDCYQASVPDTALLHAAFPDAARVSARVAANRRDRSTKWLPMLRRPHPEGLVGAIRVELRGKKDGRHRTLVLGAIDRPAVAAGTVAAQAGIWAVEGLLTRTGAGGLAELVDDSVGFLQQLSHRGVKAAVFEGAWGS